MKPNESNDCFIERYCSEHYKNGRLQINSWVKPKLTITPITKRIAEMDLPVSDWEKMEKEIEEGYRKE